MAIAAVSGVVSNPVTGRVYFPVGVCVVEWLEDARFAHFKVAHSVVSVGIAEASSTSHTNVINCEKTYKKDKFTYKFQAISSFYHVRYLL